MATLAHFFHNIPLCEVHRTFFVAKWQKLGEGKFKKKKNPKKR